MSMWVKISFNRNYKVLYVWRKSWSSLHESNIYFELAGQWLRIAFDICMKKRDYLCTKLLSESHRWEAAIIGG